MGAWGFGNFENDVAMDLVAELSETEGGATILVSSIQATANTAVSEYLDSDDAVETLVAIELLAAQKGAPPEDLPDEAEQWLEENDLLALDNFIGGSREEKERWLVGMSLRALDRIAGINSELNDLWEESEEHDEWLAVLEDLKARLLAH